MSSRRILHLSAIMLLVIAAACGGEPEETGLVEDLGTLMPGEPETPDAAEAAPDTTEVLFADDLVHVSKWTLPPGVSLPNAGSNHRLYFHSSGGGELEIGSRDESVRVPHEVGEVSYVAPDTVAITNVGVEPATVVEVTRTDVLLPEFLEVPAIEPTDIGHVIFANDVARTVELNLSPGQSADLGQVPIRVIYTPFSSRVEYRTADGDQIVIPSEVAEAYARPGDDHSITNVGEIPVTIIAFEWFI
jgi:hypothetical protein